VAAVGEYVVDVLPNTPSRTQARGLSARVVSGAFVGWMISAMHAGSGVWGAVAGIAGAVIGTYAGHAARLAAIDRIGGYPAAIVEDLVAIGLAAFIVTRYLPLRSPEPGYRGCGAPIGPVRLRAAFRRGCSG